jgi:restriction system protein
MKSRTINEAINEVFKRERKPLRVKEVFLRIKEDSLYEFNTSTPEQVVRTALRRHSESLSFPSSSRTKLYVTLSDGSYWLKGKAIPHDEKAKLLPKADDKTFAELEALYNRYLIGLKAGLLDHLKKLNPFSFEHFCKHLLTAYGFTSMVTKKTRDGGVDGHGIFNIGLIQIKTSFECKRYASKPIDSKQIKAFRGSLPWDSQQGIFFTTSRFTKDAQDAVFEIGHKPVILIDGEQIINVMIEKKIGVEVKLLSLYSDDIDLLINE